MNTNPLNMVTFSPTVDAKTRMLILEAAKWLHNLGLLVPVHVRVSKRMQRAHGKYSPSKNTVVINSDVTLPSYIQFTTIHEMIHAYQYSKDKNAFSREKYVKSGRSDNQHRAYMMQTVEREANWWAVQHANEVNPHSAVTDYYVRSYRSYGAKEFA